MVFVRGSDDVAEFSSLGTKGGGWKTWVVCRGQEERVGFNEEEGKYGKRLRGLGRLRKLERGQVSW